MEKIYKVGTINSIKEDYGLFKSAVSGTLTEVTAEQLEGIGNIGQYAFYHSPIVNITIPNNITSIGTAAFSSCKSLTSIAIPDSVTRLPSAVFFDCTSLTSVTIGNGVTSMDTNIFRGCISLTSATIGNSIKSINNGVFYGCSKLESVILSSITPPTIRSDTFKNCTTLSKIIVPKGCGDAYKSATNWSTYADIIEEATE